MLMNANQWKTLAPEGGFDCRYNVTPLWWLLTIKPAKMQPPVCARLLRNKTQVRVSSNEDRGGITGLSSQDVTWSTNVSKRLYRKAEIKWRWLWKRHWQDIWQDVLDWEKNKLGLFLQFLDGGRFMFQCKLFTAGWLRTTNGAAIPNYTTRCLWWTSLFTSPFIWHRRVRVDSGSPFSPEKEKKDEIKRQDYEIKICNYC